MTANKPPAPATELIPMSDLERMAATVAKSGLFGAKTPEHAMALMLLAQAEGVHPMRSVQDYDIIQGRPAKKSRAMLTSYQAAGGKIEWIERTDTACEARFSHPSSPQPVTVRWDTDRAKLAGLAGKDNWKKFPRQMLSARVISEGVTCTYPGATGGLYTPEEVDDMPPPREMGAVEVVAEPEPPAEPADMPAHEEAALTAANNGLDAFKKYWAGTERPVRDALRKDLEHFKKLYEAADKARAEATERQTDMAEARK